VLHIDHSNELICEPMTGLMSRWDKSCCLLLEVVPTGNQHGQATTGFICWHVNWYRFYYTSNQCTCYEGKVYVLVVACVGLAPHGWPQVACASLQLS
jgi:hypothetical protein